MRRKIALLFTISLLSTAFTNTQKLPNCGHGTIEKQILTAVNAARAQARYCGQTFYAAAKPMGWNARLEQASLKHSRDMADFNFFDHTSLNGDSFADRISTAGYRWSAVAENISAGHPSPSQAVMAWLKSPSHCANIMKANISDVGVACVHAPTSKYKYFWTMDLGHPRG